MIKDSEARRAAIWLLQRGLVTKAEATQLAGVDRQLMHHWIQRSRVDWRRTRAAVLAKLWRKATRQSY